MTIDALTRVPDASTFWFTSARRARARLGPIARRRGRCRQCRLTPSAYGKPPEHGRGRQSFFTHSSHRGSDAGPIVAATRGANPASGRRGPSGGTAMCRSRRRRGAAARAAGPESQSICRPPSGLGRHVHGAVPPWRPPLRRRAPSFARPDPAPPPPARPQSGPRRSPRLRPR